MGIPKLIDKSTVARLRRAKHILLPKKELDESKDKAWSAKKVNSQLLQGIMQGESVDKIAERIRTVTQSCYKDSVRNTRTMVTSAENSGRLDSYYEAEANGIELVKVWMATMDDRVRDSHAEIDGEEVGVDETFSNGLMYPGDESGDPSEVYNCRCTMITRVVGFE